MYRISEKINGKSTFYVQRKYGFFWSKIIAPYGYVLFSTIFFEVLAIIIFIVGVKFDNNFPLGVIPLTVGIVIIAVGSALMEDFRIYIKFNNLFNSKVYIQNKEKIKKDKLEGKTVIHYMSEREERAEKLRNINGRKLFNLFK